MYSRGLLLKWTVSYPGHSTRNEREICLLFWVYLIVNILTLNSVDFSLCFMSKFSQMTSSREVLLTNREKTSNQFLVGYIWSGLLQVLQHIHTSVTGLPQPCTSDNTCPASSCYDTVYISDHSVVTSHTFSYLNDLSQVLHTHLLSCFISLSPSFVVIP